MASQHAARIGARIRERREEVGLTQGQLARQIPGSVDVNQISRWERGVHRPHDDTLAQMAEALDVDVSYFHSDAPEPGTADLMGTLKPTASPGSALLERKVDLMLRGLDVLLEPRAQHEPFVAELLQDVHAALDDALDDEPPT